MVHYSYVTFVLSPVFGLCILLPSFSRADNQISNNFIRTGQSETPLLLPPTHDPGAAESSGKLLGEQ